MSRTRYPGAKPFAPEQKDIFFGREKEISDLYGRICLEPITVLYGKSGMGKSSLLNAGVIPVAENDGRYEPIRVRFSAWSAGRENKSPLLSAKEAVRKGAFSAKTYLDKIIKDEDSLWHDVKEHQILNNDQKGLLLIFDQFEELFTYPAEEIFSFRKQLSEALSIAVPQRYWDVLERFYEEDSNPFDEHQLSVFQSQYILKIVFVIRSDRLHLLQQLDDELPTVLKNCYELGALNEELAAVAIVEPAKANGDFSSPPFSYNRETLKAILAFLTKDGTEKIENTQLQIVCHSIEKEVERQKLDRVYPQDIGDLETIINEYYDGIINKIESPEQRLAAQKLIEDGLIFEEEERRLSIYEGQIYQTYKLKPENLQILINDHLLRAEPSLQGGYTYELSHDTLVAPVLLSKQKRKEADRIREEERIKKERERELGVERKKRRIATFYAILGFVLATAAIIASVIATTESRKSKERLVLANDARIRADQQTELANDKTKEAEGNKELAQKNAELAGRNLEKSILSEKKADEQRVIAEIALKDLKEAGKLPIQLLIAKANNLINNLDYENALQQAETAAQFDNHVDSVQNCLLEIAYFFNESQNLKKASYVIRLIDKNTEMNDKIAIEKWMQKYYPQRFAFLEERYFPKMLTVPGGWFMMGCDSAEGDCVEDSVYVGAHQMSECEISCWQYGLYLASNGENFEKKPDWGIKGDFPVVQVSWEDAVKYTVWLNQSKNKPLPIKYADRHYQLDIKVPGYRLPTEAEWEYCAKYPPNGKKFLFSGSDNLSQISWFSDNSIFEGKNIPRNIRSPKSPNPLGLYNLNGNVQEWCWDIYSPLFFRDNGNINPIGTSNGSARTIRGGGYNSGIKACKNTSRSREIARTNKLTIGFRIAMTQN